MTYFDDVKFDELDRSKESDFISDELYNDNIRLGKLDSSKLSDFIDETNWMDQLGNFSLKEIFDFIKIIDVEDNLKDKFVEKLTQVGIKLEDSIPIKDVSYSDTYFKNIKYIFNKIHFRDLSIAILKPKINIEELREDEVLPKIDQIKKTLLAINDVKELEEIEILKEIPPILFHLLYEDKYLIDTNGIVREKKSDIFYIYNYDLNKKKLSISMITSESLLEKIEYSINYQKRIINFKLNEKSFNLSFNECNMIQSEEKLMILTNKLKGKIIILENTKLEEEIDINEELISENKSVSSDFKKNNTDHIKNKKYNIIQQFKSEDKITDIFILKGIDKKKMIAFSSPNKKIVLKKIIIDLGFIRFIKNGKYIIGYDELGRKFTLKGNISQKSIANGEKILVSELQEKTETLKVIKVTVKTNRKLYRKRNKDDEEVKNFIVNRNAYIIFYDSKYTLIDYHIKDKMYLSHHIDKIILKNVTNDFAKFVVCISCKRKKEKLYFSSIITKELDFSNDYFIDFNKLNNLIIKDKFKDSESYNNFLKTGKVVIEEDFDEIEKNRKQIEIYIKGLCNPNLRTKLEEK